MFCKEKEIHRINSMAVGLRALALEHTSQVPSLASLLTSCLNKLFNSLRLAFPSVKLGVR